MIVSHSNTPMLDLTMFPQYFRSYQWQAKHALYGYPADQFPEFTWILDLERRGRWLQSELQRGGKTSGLYLLKDIIQWGGSQNGCLQKFEDGIGSISLFDRLVDVVKALPNTKTAISAAMEIPGLGLTYGSKLVRFFEPARYGALDRRLRLALEALKPHDSRLKEMPQISDYKSSAVLGYVWFCEFVTQLLDELEHQGIGRPKCELTPNSTNTEWRAADVEMALFLWATTRTGTSAAKKPQDDGTAME